MYTPHPISRYLEDTDFADLCIGDRVISNVTGCAGVVTGISAPGKRYKYIVVQEYNGQEFIYSYTKKEDTYGGLRWRSRERERTKD